MSLPTKIMRGYLQLKNSPLIYSYSSCGIPPWISDCVNFTNHNAIVKMADDSSTFIGVKLTKMDYQHLQVRMRATKGMKVDKKVSYLWKRCSLTITRSSENTKYIHECCLKLAESWNGFILLYIVFQQLKTTCNTCVHNGYFIQI